MDASHIVSKSSPDLGTEQTHEEESIPRYQKGTMASQVSSSSHAEVERIANSFRTNSFHSVKKLPSKFKPGAIEASKLRNIANSKISYRDQPYQAEVIKKYFTPLQYSRTEYNKINEIIRSEKLFRRITEQSFSR